MKKNVGKADKIVRIVLAVVLGALFAMDILTGTVGIIALVAAAMLLITGFVNFCGVYTLFGINTCKIKD
jgi:hypothetical protein